jgi:hypothetical protein
MRKYLPIIRTNMTRKDNANNAGRLKERFIVNKGKK